MFDNLAAVTSLWPAGHHSPVNEFVCKGIISKNAGYGWDTLGEL